MQMKLWKLINFFDFMGHMRMHEDYVAVIMGHESILMIRSVFEDLLVLLFL